MWWAKVKGWKDAGEPEFQPPSDEEEEDPGQEGQEQAEAVPFRQKDFQSFLCCLCFLCSREAKAQQHPKPKARPLVIPKNPPRLLGCTVWLHCSCVCNMHVLCVLSHTRHLQRREAGAAKQQRRGGTGRQPPCGAIRAGPKWMASRTRIHAELFAQEALLSRRASFLVRSKLLPLALVCS